ncbi:MAG: hypothetical protein QME45_11515 [Clostridiales bacterium]|nr:hypothetical protein [Clostridiales bacterium]
MKRWFHMDFMGFTGDDFEFFKRKNDLAKAEYNDKREQMKKHFREFCYQVQKSYHTSTGKVLTLEKDFKGLNKMKSSISANCDIESSGIFNLKIDFYRDNIGIYIECPKGRDYDGIKKLEDILTNKKDTLTGFFKGNRNMILMLLYSESKKSNNNNGHEEMKLSNNELCFGNYDMLVKKIEELLPPCYNKKSTLNIKIGMQYLKPDALKIGKALPSRACSEIIGLLDLCGAIAEN